MTYVPPDPPIVPYLMASPGHEALDWYVRALGGRETVRYDMDDGRLGHAMIELGNGGMIYLADDFPDPDGVIGTQAPARLGGTTVTLSLAVDDVDAWIARAQAQGATVIRPAADEFYGRHGKLRDPYGHVWSLIGPKREG